MKAGYKLLSSGLQKTSWFTLIETGTECSWNLFIVKFSCWITCDRHSRIETMQRHKVTCYTHLLTTKVNFHRYLRFRLFYCLNLSKQCLSAKCLSCDAYISLIKSKSVVYNFKVQILLGQIVDVYTRAEWSKFSQESHCEAYVNVCFDKIDLSKLLGRIRSHVAGESELR